MDKKKSNRIFSTSCHQKTNGIKVHNEKEFNSIRISLVGQPNCGKSTLFNQLVGYRAQTSNFPGTTVEFLNAEVVYGGYRLQITDLPGIYSLLGTEPAERVTLNYLIEHPVDVIVNIIDSSVLSRSLELTLELTTLQKPMVLVLNMKDEAEKKGLNIDIRGLEKALGIEIVETVATQGKGIDQVIKNIFKARVPNQILTLPLIDEKIEGILNKASEKIRESFPNILIDTAKILAIADSDGHLGLLDEKIKEELQNSFYKVLGNNSPWIYIHEMKHKLAMEIFEENVKVIHVKRGKSFSYLLDSIIMNQYIGPIIAFSILLLIFFLVQKVGGLLSEIFSIPFQIIGDQISHFIKNDFLRNMTQSVLDGLESGIGIVFPYFIPFILLLSFLEDIGYLARLAFVTDYFLHSIGLHGKSVVPFILGYGCNVPAVFSTRIIESDRERITTAFLVPLVPCSARLSIIFALSNLFLGFRFAFFLFILNILIVAILGKLSTFFYKSEVSDFILEIPPYRVPSIKGLISKTWFKLKDFIFFAWPIIIGGSLLLNLIQYIGLDRIINNSLSLYTKGILNLDPRLGTVLIFGILRKELALIMASEALNTPITLFTNVMTKKQIAMFVTFITFYTPCLSTILALWKEIGISKTLIQILVSLTLATALSILVGAFF